jgi:hypothetical protein
LKGKNNNRKMPPSPPHPSKAFDIHLLLKKIGCFFIPLLEKLTKRHNKKFKN